MNTLRFIAGNRHTPAGGVIGAWQNYRGPLGLSDPIETGKVAITLEVLQREQ